MKRRFYAGEPPHKKTTRQGTPTQLICRGALYGYPSMLITNIFILVQDLTKILK